MNNTLFGSQAIMVFNVTLKTLDPQLCVLPFRIVCLYRFFGVNLKSYYLLFTVIIVKAFLKFNKIQHKSQKIGISRNLLDFYNCLFEVSENENYNFIKRSRQFVFALFDPANDTYSSRKKKVQTGSQTTFSHSSNEPVSEAYHRNYLQCTFVDSLAVRHLSI